MSKARLEIDKRRAARLLILALIVAILGAAKLAYLPKTGPFGFDGGFYVNAARNVQEGHGLVTNISMYHYGQTELPTRSTHIYPAWPLLLGYTARVVGLFPAINALPPLLYVLDLLLLYVLGNRLRRSPDAIFTLGHLLVLVMGLNLEFFGTTTFPYTEGLGFFFALVALILFDRAAVTRSRWFAAATAVACGLALLTRTQMVTVGMAIVLTTIWSSMRDRRFAPIAITFTTVYGALVVYWYFLFERTVGSPRVALPAFAMWQQTHGWMDYLGDRFEGLLVSVSPVSAHSFFALFGIAFLLPIVAIPMAIVRWRRTKPRTWAPMPDSGLIVACAFVGLATVASLNLYHHASDFHVPWVFGHRHGLPMIFGVAAGAAFLFGAAKWTRVLTYIAAAATLTGLLSIVDLVTRPRVFSPTPEEAKLFDWLEQQKPVPTVLTTQSQHVSVYTHAAIHWTECRTPAAMTRNMLELLPIDYVILYPADERCEFVRGLDDVLATRLVIGDDENRIRVLARPPAR